MAAFLMAAQTHEAATLFRVLDRDENRKGSSKLKYSSRDSEDLSLIPETS